MSAGMVVVGAGEAGARAAVALRENGWTGPVTLVGAEAHPPYERPPLSKAVMVAPETPSPRFILTEQHLADHGITLLCGSPVTGIDRSEHRVTLADGRRLAYERLLIATGSTARRLQVAGAGAKHVRSLRHFGDALALRERLRPGSRLVVIGGGFIGLEIAASARARGADVTIVELAPRLLTRGVPPEIAAAVAERHRAAGVEIRLGAALEAIEGDEGNQTVVLADGSRIGCDGVVAGIGAVPETDLASRAGLEIDNGIKADARLRTSDPDIYACGDCCSFPHELYDGRRIRLEAWRNAQDQATAVAHTMLGGTQPYGAVPWFWSDQYELTLQVAGLPDEGRETVTRDLGEARLHFHLKEDGRIVAASALGPIAAIARDIRLAEILIARRARPDRAALAAPEVRLKSLLAA